MFLTNRETIAELRAELAREQDMHAATRTELSLARSRMKSAINAEQAFRLQAINAHQELADMTVRAGRAEHAQARAEAIAETAISDMAGILESAAKHASALEAEKAELGDRLMYAYDRRDAVRLTGGDVLKAGEVVEFIKGPDEAVAEPKAKKAKKADK